jgi:hypothetical protein
MSAALRLREDYGAPELRALARASRDADQTRLYEQKRQRPKGRSRLGAYVARWRTWAGGVLVGIGPDLTLFRGVADGVGSRAGLPGA